MYTQWTDEEAAGLLPHIFREDDLRTPQEQADDRYAHGGGWSNSWARAARARGDWQLFAPDAGSWALRYLDQDMRDDAADTEIMPEVSRTQLREYTIVLFSSAMVVIFRAYDDWDMARMD